jgi:hypothetical protein
MFATEAVTTDDEIASQRVDPSWFVSPVEPLSTSGGTAAFYKLTLTDKGIEEMASRQQNEEGIKIDKNLWIGKDLSHAEDEKDFYAEVHRIRSKYNEKADGNKDRDLTEGAGLLEPYMFQSEGILRTKTSSAFDDHDKEESDFIGNDGYSNLLVMRNMRSNCKEFRMLDLKIGEKTACGGWKGKSHVRAMKHHFMDGFTNSAAEGYRLCGFNGCPEAIESMDPLLDILADKSVKRKCVAKNGKSKKPKSKKRTSVIELWLEDSSVFDTVDIKPLDILERQALERKGLDRREVKTDNIQTKVGAKIKDVQGKVMEMRDNRKSIFVSLFEKRDIVQTKLGSKIKEAQIEQMEKLMYKRLDGTNVFRYFFDLHMDGTFSSVTRQDYLPIEVAEIVSHEVMSQLIGLSTACHKVKIPQKWIGSSVAVAYDAGFFPDRFLEDDFSHEANIRSKVACKIFDWGRSELLTADTYESLSQEDKADRHRFWDLYKEGVDRLSYNATRFYYNQFTTSTKWTDVTIEVADFDSMTADDRCGKVVIPLPDPSNTEAVGALNEMICYKIKGIVASTFRSTLDCSIAWIDFPTNSRLMGAWRVTIHRATKLPPMDIMSLSGTTDAYCIVTANNDCGQNFHQRTCVKARTLNPEWNESFDIPVCRTTNDSSLKSTFTANGISSIDDEGMSNFFRWDKNRPCSKNMNWWTNELKDKKDMSDPGENMKKWANTFLGKDKSNLLFNRDKNHGSKEKSKWSTMLKCRESARDNAKKLRQLHRKESSSKTFKIFGM